MFKDLQNTFGALFKKDDDPLGAITPEQLKVVLKSIEGKYNALRDENRRLKTLLDEQREAIRTLEDGHGSRFKGAEPGEPGPQQAELQALLQARLLELEGMRADGDRLLSRCEQLEGELAAARQQLDDARTEREDVERAANEERERLAAQVQELEAAVSEAGAAKEAALRLSDADGEKIALRAQLAEAQEELERLKLELESQPAELPPADPGEALGQATEELQGQLREAEEATRSALAAREAAAERARQLEQDLRAEQERARQLEQELLAEQELGHQQEADRARLDDLQAALTSATARTATAEEETTRLRDQIAQLSARLVEAAAEKEEALAKLAEQAQLEANRPDGPHAEPPGELHDMQAAIVALTEQVQRLTDPASAQRTTHAERFVPPVVRPVTKPKQATGDDPARKLDWLLGL